MLRTEGFYDGLITIASKSLNNNLHDQEKEKKAKFRKYEQYNLYFTIKYIYLTIISRLVYNSVSRYLLSNMLTPLSLPRSD